MLRSYNNEANTEEVVEEQAVEEQTVEEQAIEEEVIQTYSGAAEDKIICVNDENIFDNKTENKLSTELSESSASVNPEDEENTKLEETENLQNAIYEENLKTLSAHSDAVRNDDLASPSENSNSEATKECKHEPSEPSEGGTQGPRRRRRPQNDRITTDTDTQTRINQVHEPSTEIKSRNLNESVQNEIFLTPTRNPRVPNRSMPIDAIMLSDSDGVPIVSPMSLSMRSPGYGTPGQSLNPRRRSNSRASHVVSQSSSTVTLARSFALEEVLTPYIKTLRERAYRFEQLNDLSLDDLDQLDFALKQESKNLARERKFKDGLRCNSVIQHVNLFLAKARYHEKQQTITLDLKEEEDEFQNALAQFDNETKEKEQALLESQRQARNDLKASQKQDLEDLEQLWNSPVKRRNYNRPSPRLAELHRQMNICLAATKFEDADLIRKDIIKLKKEESENAFRKMQHDFDEAQVAMRKKHKQDTAFFEESCRIKMEKLKQQRAKRRRAYEFHEKNLKRRSENAEKIISQSTTPTQIKVSRRLTVKDVENKDAELLELPPLESPSKKVKVPKSMKADSS
ncbi:hypothetical protein TRFO_42810 [Tritrichomonas foetus]|uniref:Uncharacterized protein n=1 Tax=Tritrichomonas foetus TaxID=1144522 RepID=A0A1J4KUI4_9EUKA|nr:hypothetical protein TRFO_42810 [Tritrichomonas foetus]|eukprot:OHT14931.1 hypothetical protein TRFO_42810 [Tritrichomonas foetus]